MDWLHKLPHMQPNSTARMPYSNEAPQGTGLMGMDDPAVVTQLVKQILAQQQPQQTPPMPAPRPPQQVQRLAARQTPGGQMPQAGQMPMPQGGGDPMARLQAMQQMTGGQNPLALMQFLAQQGLMGGEGAPQQGNLRQIMMQKLQGGLMQ